MMTKEAEEEVEEEVEEVEEVVLLAVVWPAVV